MEPLPHHYSDADGWMAYLPLILMALVPIYIAVTWAWIRLCEFLRDVRRKMQIKDSEHLP